jgi:hypothetical protein
LKIICINSGDFIEVPILIVNEIDEKTSLSNEVTKNRIINTTYQKQKSIQLNFDKESIHFQVKNPSSNIFNISKPKFEQKGNALNELSTNDWTLFSDFIEFGIVPNTNLNSIETLVESGALLPKTFDTEYFTLKLIEEQHSDKFLQIKVTFRTEDSFKNIFGNQKYNFQLIAFAPLLNEITKQQKISNQMIQIKATAILDVTIEIDQNQIEKVDKTIGIQSNIGLEPLEFQFAIYSIEMIDNELKDLNPTTTNGIILEPKLKNQLKNNHTNIFYTLSSDELLKSTNNQTLPFSIDLNSGKIKINQNIWSLNDPNDPNDGNFFYNLFLWFIKVLFSKIFCF